jgi:hypothetical protein
MMVVSLTIAIFVSVSSLDCTLFPYSKLKSNSVYFVKDIFISLLTLPTISDIFILLKKIAKEQDRQSVSYCVTVNFIGWLEKEAFFFSHSGKYWCTSGELGALRIINCYFFLLICHFFSNLSFYYMYLFTMQIFRRRTS